jgi:hypothetical protein
MILVFSTCRTGALAFCGQLAFTNNIPNTGRIFSENMPERVVVSIIERLYEYPNCVVNVNALDLSNKEVARNLHKLIKLASKIFVVVRRDLHAQIKSMYAWFSRDTVYTDAAVKNRTLPVVFVDSRWDKIKQHIFSQHAFLSETVNQIAKKQFVFSEDIPRLYGENILVYNFEPPQTHRDISMWYNFEEDNETGL